MSDRRFPLTIPVKHWFQDHCFAGKIVLPAVETMLLLAAKAHELYPEVDIRVMENVRFAKFLEISPESSTIESLVECEKISADSLQATLFSRTVFKTMSRIKEHGTVEFSSARTQNLPASNIDLTRTEMADTEIAVDYLYSELVPFGPHYQTLQDILYLSDDQAWGRLKAPELAIDPIQEIVGSPFPLDGAFHAACVLGQQVVSFVPFPVGFDKRVISRPTQPGGYYQTRVKKTMQTETELVFDLVIAGDGGQVYETVTGVRMRDVSGTIRK